MKKTSSKKTLSMFLVAFLTMAMLPMLTTPAMGATDAQIEESGAAAVAYLASVQNPDGSWGFEGYEMAKTGLVLLKFLARAKELHKDPFDNEPSSPTYYEYANNVIVGFNYILSNAQVLDIAMQTHGNPDTNSNGKGITWSGGFTYYTGIVLAAITLSGHPDDKSAVIGSLGSLTYKQIAQDVVDWLAYAQGDMGNARGGYAYYALNNESYWTDNSNAGYAYLGLAFAEDPPFSCTIPQWVKDELNVWITTIQDPVDGDANDGGSWYNPDWTWNPWCNVLKTGNLIFEMAFYGDSPSTPRVQAAVAYLERHWRDPNMDPGWGYSLPIGNYQAKFLVEKGLTYMGIDRLDTDGDGVDESWYNQDLPAVPPEDFASAIVAQQLPSGGWPRSEGAHDYWQDAMLSTAWAVLTLERFAPPPEVIPVYIDIKPASWPNPINIKSNGVLPIAICGTADFDVTTIDPATIKLTREGIEVGVSPIRWTYEDVATPWTGEYGGGHDLGGDGYLDLTLKFSTQEVVAALGLDAYLGQRLPLVITGNLLEAFGGTFFKGQDYVWILQLNIDSDDLVVTLLEGNKIAYRK